MRIVLWSQPLSQRPPTDAGRSNALTLRNVLESEPDKGDWAILRWQRKRISEHIQLGPFDFGGFYFTDLWTKVQQTLKNPQQHIFFAPKLREGGHN